MKKFNYSVKIVTGFRKDQEYTIDANEAHKAYYLFNNPTKRGTFNNGLAIKGSDIQKIVPDYNATMGFNDTHVLTGDDWNEIHCEGVKVELQGIMGSASQIGKLGLLVDFSEPLSELIKNKYPQLDERTGSKFAQKVLKDAK